MSSKTIKPTTKTILAKNLPSVLPGLGKTQEVRYGNGADWDLGALVTEIEATGWDEARGERPWMVEGETSPRDGNRRLTAMAFLATDKPGTYGDVKVKIDVYPASMTDEQKQELTDRAIRTKKAMTQKDFHHYVMNKKLRNPGLSQLDAAKEIGVGMIRSFYAGAFNPEALEPDGLGGHRIKAGWSGAKVFKNKQGPIQTGFALAEAHPVVREMFFTEDTDKFLDYRQVLEANGFWRDDKARDAGIVTALTLPELAKRMPESKLVGFVAPILEHGRTTKGGRKPGEAAAMDTKTRLGLVNTFATCPFAVALLNLVNGAAGFNTEANMADLEVVGRAISKAMPAEAQSVLDRVFARASAISKAQADKLAAQADGPAKGDDDQGE